MNPSSQEARRRQALAKVYALLLSLADEEHETAHPEDFGENTGQAAEQPTPEGADHEDFTRYSGGRDEQGK